MEWEGGQVHAIDSNEETLLLYCDTECRGCGDWWTSEGVSINIHLPIPPGQLGEGEECEYVIVAEDIDANVCVQSIVAVVRAKAD